MSVLVGLHTYFVGEQGAWVHNACVCGPSGAPTTAMKNRFKDNGVLDPKTNKFRPLQDGEIMAVDHIYPKQRIKEMDGYDELSYDQKKKLLDDDYGLGNLQPLPGGLNSSKGSKVDWDTYRKEGLQPDYVENLKNVQQDLQEKIQNKIYDLLDE